MMLWYLIPFFSVSCSFCFSFSPVILRWPPYSHVGEAAALLHAVITRNAKVKTKYFGIDKQIFCMTNIFHAQLDLIIKTFSSTNTNSKSKTSKQFKGPFDTPIPDRSVKNSSTVWFCFVESLFKIYYNQRKILHKWDSILHHMVKDEGLTASHYMSYPLNNLGVPILWFEMHLVGITCLLKCLALPILISSTPCILIRRG